MIHFLTEPFEYAFIQRAVFAAIIVGLLCAALGTFVVLRRMSLVGHALTHSALPGLVIAYLLGWNIFVGALIATLLTAMGIGFLAKDEAVYEDTSLGIIPTVMFALGILLISTTQSYRDLSAMLFGNILGIGRDDLNFIVLIAVMTLAVVFLFYKELKLFTVDPNYARAIGIPVNALRYGLLFFLALTVVVGIQAVGTILTSALLVIPVAAARLLTDRLGVMITLSCLFSVVSSVGGVYASYYLGLSSGASIVLFCALSFMIAWIFKYARLKMRSY